MCRLFLGTAPQKFIIFERTAGTVLHDKRETLFTQVGTSSFLKENCSANSEDIPGRLVESFRSPVLQDNLGKKGVAWFVMSLLGGKGGLFIRSEGVPLISTTTNFRDDLLDVKEEGSAVVGPKVKKTNDDILKIVLCHIFDFVEFNINPLPQLNFLQSYGVARSTRAFLGGFRSPSSLPSLFSNSEQRSEE